MFPPKAGDSLPPTEEGPPESGRIAALKALIAELEEMELEGLKPSPPQEAAPEAPPMDAGATEPTEMGEEDGLADLPPEVLAKLKALIG